MVLTARTRLVGLVGWPVSHSRSPAMHNAAFAALGLEWAYLPLPVAPQPEGRILEAVRGLAALGFRGANVTVPHKQAVIPALHSLTPAAEAMGAVNTIIVEEDATIVGDNTDAAGFAADLAAHGVSVSGQQVLVLGAGGSARAVVHALAAAGAERVIIANRTVERARELASSLETASGATELLPAALDQAIRQWGGEVSLVVNTTSLGMSPAVDGLPWDDSLAFREGQTVYDLVYAPTETRLLRMAAANGARAIGGIGMLVRQGALAFERWTGQPAPFEVMLGAALAHGQPVAGA